ncbi:MAG: hydroxymethylglutaryl-CoA lyase [Alphaproteobacteria bacterium]|nr:hydroxymethylglutaryl-CoA lyase [Alphaproteobacteria bacterium]
MADYPRFVHFHEEGPREGFQMEPRAYPLAERAALVDALGETGLRRIQVASFVSPKAVPNMADAEDLFAAIQRRDGVRHTALWLNRKGFERAAAVPQVDLDPRLLFYTTDGFSRLNNNCTAVEMRDAQADWLDLYRSRGLTLESAYIMTAFGCNFDGAVPVAAVTELARWVGDLCADRGAELPVLVLADTVGWASPDEVKRRVGAVRETLPGARVGLHLHDTRGLGAANVLAALEVGVDLFESSVAGLGGCPFAGHGNGTAAGNICTEDMVFLCHELGIETGIDLDALIEAARLAERIIGRPLAGRLMRSGSLSAFRGR